MKIDPYYVMYSAGVSLGYTFGIRGKLRIFRRRYIVGTLTNEASIIIIIIIILFARNTNT